MKLILLKVYFKNDEIYDFKEDINNFNFLFLEL